MCIGIICLIAIDELVFVAVSIEKIKLVSKVVKPRGDEIKINEIEEKLEDWICQIIKLNLL